MVAICDIGVNPDSLEIQEAYAPFSGSNCPPFSIVFLNVESRRLKVPSGSVFIFWMSDCPVVSLVVDMLL